MIKYSVNMACGAEIGNKIYMSSISLNGLFEYDLQEKRLKYLSPFANELPCYAIHRGAISYGDEIWFVPQNGNFIAILNVIDRRIEYLKPEFEKSFLSPFDKLPTISYCFGKFDESKLYILPAAIDAVNIIDMKTRELGTVKNVITDGECICSGIYHAGMIHAFTIDGKWRIEIDPVRLEAKRYSWCGLRVADIKWIDQLKVYFISVFGKYTILTADENFENIETYKYMPEENKKYGTMYMRVSKDGFYLFPWRSACIEKITLSLKKNRSIDLSKMVGDEIFYNPVDSNRYTMGVTVNAPILIVLNENDDEIGILPLKVNIDEIQKQAALCGVEIKDLFWKNDFAIILEEKMGLNGFLEYVRGL